MIRMTNVKQYELYRRYLGLQKIQTQMEMAAIATALAAAKKG
jgi:hypothetical protein